MAETSKVNMSIDTSSIDLLEYISWKSEYPQEAMEAFTIFCNRFQKDILEKAEIHCVKNGYSSDIAEMISNCTFERVWKYPSFTMDKAKSKDTNKAILLWMYPIMRTQALLYFKENSCAEPSIEEDLSIIENMDELIEYTAPNQPEKKKDLKMVLEVVDQALSQLSDKHRIIYLTYKAYEQKGKNIPRSLSKQLQEKLKLTQNSIRVYKKEASEQVKNFIERTNGIR
ncbi:MAG: RNA polymerase subunit sigma [Dysgonomonas sp.]|nr:RNA polymerase subunit sigma [Dysgonomonas sp.]